MRWFKLAVVVVLIALATAASVTNPARASVQQDFIAKLVEGARENERRTGIPASVTIGMAALESGWGRSTMAGTMTVNGTVYKVNTLFNIKCTSTPSPYQTGCVPVSSYEYRADGTKYLKVSNFRTYASWADSMLDFGRFLTTLSRYAPAFDYTRYPDQFVTEVRRAGYATDPKYSELVISIMRSYSLYQYNVSGAGPGYPSGADTDTPVVVDPVFKSGPDFPALSRGSRGTVVESLQTLLNAAGSTLLVDGSYGALTEGAVKTYQSSQGLSATGAVDDQTWSRLLPSLRAGDSGERVSALQLELKAEGLAVTVNGTFDPATEAAVRSFQERQRIKPNGAVGLATWARLLG